ncbi:Swarming motility protein SwrC [compost metagenome]
MKSLIRFSMKNATAVLLLVAVLAAGGYYAVSQMKMEKYPDVDIPYLHVNIVYPGASPEQSMRDVGEVLEKEFQNIDGVTGVYTWGAPNAYSGVIKTSMSVNMDKIEEEARNVVSKAKLPEGTGEPVFFSEKLDPEIYTVAYSGADQEKLQRFVEDEAVPAVKAVGGIGQVEVKGIQDKKIYIQVKPDKLKEKGLTLDQVQQMITANHVNIPIGDIKTSSQILPVRMDDTLRSIEDIKNIRLFATAAPQSALGGETKLNSFTLGEIADITYRASDETITHMNGEPAVTISVLSKGGDDAVGMVKQIKNKLSSLTIPSGIKQELLLDQSEDIEHSVYGMLREVLLGCLMAVAVTLLFLRNLRSTLIAVISIPLSMLASFIVLNQLGYTLNMMTLAGIAVAIGRVVDDSIVVIENVFRRVRGAQERDSELVEQATREVSSAITSSTLTTVAVFLPLAFVPGIVGKFFVPLAWTIVISLLFSLLVAVTIVPLMSRLFLLKIKHREHKEGGLQKIYRRMLSGVLRHRAVTLSLAIVLLAGSMAIPAAGAIGFNFLPSEKPTNFNVDVTMPVGTNGAVTQKVVKAVEQAVKAEPGVERTFILAGNEDGRVSFKVTKEADTSRIGEELRKKFSDIKGAESIVLVGLGGIGGNNLNIIVNGPSRESIVEGANQIAAAIRKIDGLADVRSSAQGEKPEIAIDLNHARVAEKGLTPAQVASSLRMMVTGGTIASMDINNKPSDMILQLQTDHTGSAEQLKEQEVTGLLGQHVKLGDLGDIKKVQSRTMVAHLDQKEYMEVYAAITDNNSAKVSSDAFAAINALKLPNGVSWTSEGAAKEMNDGFISMGIALLISIVLVYFVMLLAFGQAMLPFVILASIPFSVIGAIGGLFLAGEPIGMPAMIGLLMLNGIVVTNAIVLLDRVKQNEQKGMEKREALIEAGVTRVRPILMTAIATVGALLPLALSTEAGLVSRALAVVVIGGLVSSTLLTLLIVPVIYSFMGSRPEKVKQKVLVPVKQL